ncbi:uncharacterized protein MYCFIDRAFT_179839 [Pseudocercospora fijiensis CIRAD86]|uniref:DUF6590 domain-containing protein n=1 Tax=Pseudocercospora fijiensis (strain CIRAD86) TaxID=383855 RepID=M3AII3_PSEFD|nr:uncharacterized protein MYCFIDRAFT_179839 [Pseudocercospora fijiensis CIRAD86]EME77257.1 hypothetical protein MYCFIDRAFT_179839 [Pseudocercospora fijiensis CIRAD86]
MKTSERVLCNLLPVSAAAAAAAADLALGERRRARTHLAKSSRTRTDLPDAALNRDHRQNPRSWLPHRCDGSSVDGISQADGFAERNLKEEGAGLRAGGACWEYGVCLCLRRVVARVKRRQESEPANADGLRLPTPALHSLCLSKQHPLFSNAPTFRQRYLVINVESIREARWRSDSHGVCWLYQHQLIVVLTIANAQAFYLVLDLDESNTTRGQHCCLLHLNTNSLRRIAIVPSQFTFNPFFVQSCVNDSSPLKQRQLPQITTKFPRSNPNLIFRKMYITQPPLPIKVSTIDIDSRACARHCKERMLEENFDLDWKPTHEALGKGVKLGELIDVLHERVRSVCPYSKPRVDSLGGFGLTIELADAEDDVKPGRDTYETQEAREALGEIQDLAAENETEDSKPFCVPRGPHESPVEMGYAALRAMDDEDESESSEDEIRYIVVIAFFIHRRNASFRSSTSCFPTHFLRRYQVRMPNPSAHASNSFLLSMARGATFWSLMVELGKGDVVPDFHVVLMAARPVFRDSSNNVEICHFVAGMGFSEGEVLERGLYGLQKGWKGQKVGGWAELFQDSSASINPFSASGSSGSRLCVPPPTLLIIRYRSSVVLFPPHPCIDSFNQILRNPCPDALNPANIVPSIVESVNQRLWISAMHRCSTSNSLAIGRGIEIIILDRWAARARAGARGREAANQDLQATAVDLFIVHAVIGFRSALRSRSARTTECNVCPVELTFITPPKNTGTISPKESLTPMLEASSSYSSVFDMQRHGGQQQQQRRRRRQSEAGLRRSTSSSEVQYTPPGPDDEEGRRIRPGGTTDPRPPTNPRPRPKPSTPSPETCRYISEQVSESTASANTSNTLGYLSDYGSLAGPSGTSSLTADLDQLSISGPASNLFGVRDARFFEIGRVFTIPGDGVDQRFQNYVVVQKLEQNQCLVLPITTYGRQGVAKTGVVKANHGTIYHGSRVPEPRSDERPHLRQPSAMAIQASQAQAAYQRMLREGFTQYQAVAAMARSLQERDPSLSREGARVQAGSPPL